MKINSHMIDLALAFNEARLAALHIDMQLKFYEDFCCEGRIPTREVFPLVREFAKNLRDLGVPNHWIAYTGHWAKSVYADYKTGKLEGNRPSLARDLSILPSMGAQDSDMVFEKAQQWGFRNANCVLTDYLRSQNQDTLIIDGVKDKHCIAGTISTGLKKDFRIYVVMDATNCPVDEFNNYVAWFLRPNDLTEEQKSKVTFTTREEVLLTIKIARQGLVPAQKYG